MNYRQMLDKFKDLEQRLRVSENQLQALQLRVTAMEKPQFTPTLPAPGPQWPAEFWPTTYTNTMAETSK